MISTFDAVRILITTVLLLAGTGAWLIARGTRAAYKRGFDEGIERGFRAGWRYRLENGRREDTQERVWWVVEWHGLDENQRHREGWHDTGYRSAISADDAATQYLARYSSQWDDWRVVEVGERRKIVEQKAVQLARKRRGAEA